MPPDRDHYAAYYADKIWNLLPAIYRTVDAPTLGKGGPLRELVERIGAQAAEVRRNIDRLWEDQSIESCDAWVVAYIADLLATNLVSDLDDRARRLDVAKTIYYRRRKGTAPLLEELATDTTGWGVRLVEFFRRLGRTWHSLDRPITDFLRALTPSGGTADLRSASTATLSQTAFDTFSHTADFRRGSSGSGWHSISRLGFFLWRISSLALGPVTPVPVAGCPGHFTCDPTGRITPLFARGDKTQFDDWTSPNEWELPAVVRQSSWDAPAIRSTLYPDSLAAFRPATAPATGFTQLPSTDVRVIAKWGRVKITSTPKPFVLYYQGFAAEIGAGPFDRQSFQNDLARAPTKSFSNGIDLSGLPATGLVEIGDSLTYVKASDLAVVTDLTVRSRNRERPLIRLPAPTASTPSVWAITAATEQSTLRLDGLFVSGGDLVLRGNFAEVALTYCTLDPGTTAPAGSAGAFALAADKRVLQPTRLIVEGTIERLKLSHCISGPVILRGTGRVESLTVSESIVQALPASTGPVVALDLSGAEINLTRSTILGGMSALRIEASECILHQPATAADIQSGSIRFSAWADGSVLPRKYESVRIPAGATLFETTEFGQPAFGLLRSDAPTAVGQGNETSGEMGAFARELLPARRRGLLAKLQEYTPLGMTPVLINVT